MFYFIEKSVLYNFADDNSLLNVASSKIDLISNLQHDSEICIKWYANNGMAANPSKFQFMISSTTDVGCVEIRIAKDIVIQSEPFVKALGVYIDNRLTFSEHVNQCSKRAARQLNALSRISKYLSVDSKKHIFRSFIMSNFTYCSVVWHFCGLVNNSKLEKIQERALKIVFNEYDSNYDALLDKMGTYTMLQSRLRNIIIEVFKSLNDINPMYMKELFNVKKQPYSLRDTSLLIQARKNTTNFGLRSFVYLGSKLWNNLPGYLKDTTDIDVGEFKSRLKNYLGVNHESWETPVV